MEGRVALFMATVVLLMMISTEAYKCYNCRYVSTVSGWQNASCPEPFNPSGVSTCEGTYCVAVWANFTSPTGYVLQRTCTSDSSVVTVDQCEERGRITNKPYFLYQNRCCLLMRDTSVPGDNRRFDQMTCGCQSDHCNGAVPYPVIPHNSAPGSRSLMGFVMFCTTVAFGFGFLNAIC